MLRRERPPALEQFGERLALDELGDDVVRAVVGAGVLDGDDAGVVQPRGRVRLAAEPFDERLIAVVRR